MSDGEIYDSAPPMPQLRITYDEGSTGKTAAAVPHDASARPSFHILLVDDDALIRGATAELLSGAGYATIEAASGAEALEILEGDEAIDLLITDNRMPGITGADLISHVRSNAPALPILLVTGYASRGDDISPDIPLLGKPFREAALLAAVRKLIPAQPAMIGAVG
jgi:CheY-like chemotaxis protein